MALRLEKIFLVNHSYQLEDKINNTHYAYCCVTLFVVKCEILAKLWGF